MDVDEIIGQLQDDVERIKRVIDCLEQLRGMPVATDSLPTGQERRRGRKSMAPGERLEVSARMKKYWANRRRQRSGPSS